MRAFAVYQDDEDGSEFKQAFQIRNHAEAAKALGLGNVIEEIVIHPRPLEFKIKHTWTGRWRTTRGVKGIPMSGNVEWSTKRTEMVFWEIYSGYEDLPDVDILKSSIQQVQVVGVDKVAVARAYSHEARRWQQNRASLMDLTGGTE